MGLTSVTIAGTVTSLVEKAFSGCRRALRLTALRAHFPLTVIPTGAREARACAVEETPATTHPMRPVVRGEIPRCARNDGGRGMTG
ncbi:MAG: hypothetical protein LBB79_01990, partial [Prevotellaceae bacterium]|nr:hypothetical protein [Prevotellaceae bacterium]